MIVEFMLMSPEKAQYFRDQTQGEDEILDPVEIRGGEHIGLYGLPTRLKEYAPFERFYGDFASLTVVELEREVAFPPEVEEDE